MLERLRDLLSRIKFPVKRTKAPKPDKSDTNEGGAVYKLWLLVLPVIGGLVMGYLASVGLGYAFGILAGSSAMTDASVSGSRESSQSSSGPRGLDGFLSANPFHISPQKPDTPAPAPKVEEAPKTQVATTLDDVILRGTLPGIGGWFEQKGKLSLILVGKNIGRYRLASVKYNEAVFRRGTQSVRKLITYGPVAEAKSTPAPAPKAAPAPAPTPQPLQTGTVTAATGDTEGSVPAELVNSLVQNPFDELKRIRMRPNEKAGGLEVQWIQNDSLLKRLGVQRGDVIKSVNGIPFTNMGDIANSITSLMNSERFDVEVTRGGNSTALRYVVK